MSVDIPHQQLVDWFTAVPDCAWLQHTGQHISLSPSNVKVLKGEVPRGPKPITALTVMIVSCPLPCLR